MNVESLHEEDIIPESRHSKLPKSKPATPLTGFSIISSLAQA